MTRRFLAASTLALTLAFAQPALAQSAEEDFTTLREEVWQWTLDNSPDLATSIGDRRGDGLLGDASLAGYEAQVAETRAFLARLEAIDAGALPEPLRIDYAIMARDFRDTLEAATFDHSRYVVFTNRGGPQGAIAGLPYGSPLFTLADYESYLGRLEAFPEYVAHVIDRSETAIELGLTQPCEPMQGYENSITGLIAASPEELVWWSAFATRPATISEADWAALASARAQRDHRRGLRGPAQLCRFLHAGLCPRLPRRCRAGCWRHAERAGVLRLPRAQLHHHRDDSAAGPRSRPQRSRAHPGGNGSGGGGSRVCQPGGVYRAPAHRSAVLPHRRGELPAIYRRAGEGDRRVDAAPVRPLAAPALYGAADPRRQRAGQYHRLLRKWLAGDRAAGHLSPEPDRAGPAAAVGTARARRA